MADLQPIGALLADDIKAGKLLAARAARKASRLPQSARKPSSSHGASTDDVRAKAAQTLSWVKPTTQSTTQPAPPSAPAVCSICKGVGVVRVTEISDATGWQSRVEPCTCQTERIAQERWQRALKASDMDEALLALDFTGYDATYNPEALDAARAWAASGAEGIDGRAWLFFWGGFGTGKTHLLAAAFNALIAARSCPVYTVVPPLLDYLRQALDNQDSNAYFARLKAVQETPILILDDLGAEKRTDWTDETLFKLLDYRYRAELPTAVASNVMPDNLEHRIASRLQDAGLSTVIPMVGPDFRQERQPRRTTKQKRTH